MSRRAVWVGLMVAVGIFKLLGGSGVMALTWAIPATLLPDG